MEHPFPIGMGLRVPHPSQAAPATSNTTTTTVTGSYAQQYQYCAGGQQTTTLEPKVIEVDEDGLCEFDQMDAVQVTLACFSLYEARLLFCVDEGVYRQAH